LLDPRATAVKARRLLGGGQAAAREHESADAEAADRPDLGRPIAKATVLREHREVFATAELEPLDVRNLLVALAEDLMMRPDRPSGSSKGVGDAVSPEAAIEEELKLARGV
jgi:hypothetical protein